VRWRIETELLTDHERSDRAIATLVGASQPTVSKIRAELEDIDKIYRYRATAGKPRKDGTPAQPRPETVARQAEVEQAIQSWHKESPAGGRSTAGLSSWPKWPS
jgi:DNA-binding Lrp family transcriptional regulator